MVWDEANLYVAFASTDAEPWGRLKNRDARLWQEEVVEIFLDPDGDGRNYAEVEVSPHNVVVDLLIPQPRAGGKTAIEWNIAGLRSAVSRHPAGWIGEIAIPWTSLAAAGVTAAPKPGDQWRAGLYRIKRPGGPAKAEQIAKLGADADKATGAQKQTIEAEMEKLRASDEYSAWSVTRPERGFHDPERFGYVQFMAPAPTPSTIGAPRDFGGSLRSRPQGLTFFVIARRRRHRHGVGGVRPEDAREVVQGYSQSPAVRRGRDQQRAQQDDGTESEPRIRPADPEIDQHDDAPDRKAVADDRERPRVSRIALVHEPAHRTPLEMMGPSGKDESLAAVRAPFAQAPA